MLVISDAIKNVINSPVRNVGMQLKVFTDGVSTISTYTEKDAIKEVKIDRVGEDGKFFGFGVCQKINAKLIDIERKLDFSTANTIIALYTAGGGSVAPCPNFRVTEVHRDENTNELSITAYDALYNAAAHTVSELGLENYTIGEFAVACGNLLNGNGANINGLSAFDTTYETGANFDGTETIRKALDAIAAATQTIYFINAYNVLEFKRLDLAAEPVLTIDREKYFTLDSSTNRRLTTICHATELGDNVSISTTEIGTTQYVRDNPFWELREDIETLLQAAIAAAGGLTINQFVCSWRGNFGLEIGDCIALVTKDNKTVISYMLNDVISYDGTLSEQTQWSYTDNNIETAENPVTLGDALKQTYARVDKANRQIDLVASDVGANNEKISALQINTDSISASVSNVETNLNDSIESMNEDIENLTNRVDAVITPTDVQLQIESALNNGIDSVTTKTGFTFNEDGLTVSKSGSEMTTAITEDGMKVYRDNTQVLVADNVGVVARNLHAETYLIIGTNSRFEDYAESRTGCFWIGK